jgi:hypothetical protein
MSELCTFRGSRIEAGLGSRKSLVVALFFLQGSCWAVFR